MPCVAGALKLGKTSFIGPSGRLQATHTFSSKSELNGSVQKTLQQFIGLLLALAMDFRETVYFGLTKGSLHRPSFNEQLR